MSSSNTVALCLKMYMFFRIAEIIRLNISVSMRIRDCTVLLDLIIFEMIANRALNSESDMAQQNNKSKSKKEPFLPSVIHGLLFRIYSMS